MITTLNINPQELTVELFQQIKSMFSSYKHIEIEIRSGSDSLLDTSETSQEYEKRISTAINNLESNENVKSFSETEFQNFANDLMKA